MHVLVYKLNKEERIYFYFIARKNDIMLYGFRVNLISERTS